MLEKTIKAAVRKRLKELGTYQYWPVPMGLGTATLDCLFAYKGRAFAIETKRPGGKLTARQQATIKEMQTAGIVVFVIDDLNKVNTYLCDDYLEM